VKPRTQTIAARPAAVPSVLHIDSSREWSGAQDQLRLLMREFEILGLRQLCICPDGSALAQRLHDDGLPVHGIAWVGGTDPRAILSIAARLDRYHLAHCHDARALRVTLLPAAVTHTPVIATRRTCAPPRRFMWNRARRVIATSHAVRHALLQAGVRPRGIRVVQPGIDMQELRDTYAGHTALSERLTLDGDIFVAADSAHAFDVGILEAMALGVPVVAPDSGMNREVLGPVHAVTGVALYSGDDAAARVAYMQRIRDDAVLRDQIVIAQNRRIGDFRIEKTAMETLDVYREALR
jgi:glycosyltransferase involved in cell wall biosynthesis